MYTLCWSPKGGSGTTVVAAALALLSARERPTVLIDLGGDAPAALGLGVGGEPGVLDWIAAPHADNDALFRLATGCCDDLGLIGRGSSADHGASLTHADWARLCAACDEQRGVEIIVDAGPHLPPAGVHGAPGRSLLILRPCYLAVHRAVQRVEAPAGIVVISEPGRALGRTDLERALSMPVLAEIPWDPAIARAVDAGLLATARLPLTLSRNLRRLTTAAAT